MAILDSDVKLMEPQRISDEDDGGGAMSGLENIISGGILNQAFFDLVHDFFEIQLLLHNLIDEIRGFDKG